MLERIVALLLALAALVDRAADLPARRRLLLLAILGSGEAEVRSLIAAMASDHCLVAPAEAVAAPLPTAGEAALLAARFRVLALAVDTVLAQADPRPACWRTSPSGWSPGPQGRRIVPALRPPDTS